MCCLRNSIADPIYGIHECKCGTCSYPLGSDLFRFLCRVVNIEIPITTNATNKDDTVEDDETSSIRYWNNKELDTGTVELIVLNTRTNIMDLKSQQDVSTTTTTVAIASVIII
jgi:hypothetical protein